MNDKRKQQLIRVYETLPTDKLKEMLSYKHSCMKEEVPLIKAELFRRNTDGTGNSFSSESVIKKTDLVYVKIKRRMLLQKLALVVLGIGVLWIVGLFTESEPEQNTPSKPNGYTAFYQSQYYVKQQLKSPSTAKFPNPLNNRELLGVDLGEGKFRVSAYVDSQNSFGVVMRNRYTCTLIGIETVDGNKWILESMEFY